MKSRFLSAALATIAVAGATLTLTGTASAAPGDAREPRVRAEVRCDNNGRGVLHVEVRNRSDETVNVRVRSEQYGSERQRRVAPGTWAEVMLPTNDREVDPGKVDVITRTGGERQFTTSADYAGKDCRSARKPQIAVEGRDGNGNGNLNRVIVTNTDDVRISVRVVTGQQSFSRSLAPRERQVFVLNDRAERATVFATKRVGGETLVTVRRVQA